jgi:hypothetical protein
MSFRLSIVWEAERPTVDYFEYMFAGQHVGVRRIPGPETKYKVIHEGDQLAQIVLTGPKFLKSLIKCYGFPSEALGYFRNPSFLPSLQEAFENLFAKVHYLGPIRPYLLRVYEWGGESPVDAGWDGDQAISALLASETATQAAEWLKNIGLSLRLEFICEDDLRAIAQRRRI